MLANSAADSSTRAAPRFSVNRYCRVVPGIGTIHGLRAQHPGERNLGHGHAFRGRNAADFVQKPLVSAAILAGEAGNDVAEVGLVERCVRLGESLEKDMVAVRIGPDLRFALVASPGYLASHEAIMSPRDLPGHTCINLRMATRGDLYVWEFEKDQQELNVRVEGQFVVNDSGLAVEAARAGHGLALVFEDMVADALSSGALVRLLEDWCPPFAGHHLYYPDRHDLPAAFAVVVEQLRAAVTSA